MASSQPPEPFLGTLAARAPRAHPHAPPQSRAPKQHLPCPICHAAVPNIATHIRGTHSSTHISPDQAAAWGVFVCPVCNKPYTTEGSLRTHINAHKGAPNAAPPKHKRRRVDQDREPVPAAPQAPMHIPIADIPQCPMYLSHPLQTLEYVPHYLHKEWTDVCRIALLQYERDRDGRDAARAIHNLLMIPYRTLRRIRGGKSGRTTMRRRIAATTAHLMGDAQAPDEEQRATRPQLARQWKDQLVAKATAKTARGYVKRAAASLLQRPILEATPEVIAKLEALHPPRLDQIPPQAAASDRVIPNEKDFRSLIHHKVANGASPGPSGWTGDMIRLLADDQDCRRGLLTLTADLCNGNIPPEAQHLLRLSILVPLDKSGGDGPDPRDPKVRPVAMGEVFLRMAAIYVCDSIRDELAKVLQPINFAVGVQGGSQTATSPAITPT